MICSRTDGFVAWLAVGAGLICAAPAGLAQSYTILDLGTLGGYMSRGFGLNNFNHVVGSAFTADAALHGLLWNQGLNEILPLPGNLQSEAFGINDGNVAVGMSYNMGQQVMNGILFANGQATALGPIGARGINNLGEVVGYLSLNDPNFGWVDHAAHWSGGALTDLGTLGGHFAYLYAINDRAQAVGLSFMTGDNVTHAALWKNGVWKDLGTLGGANSGAYSISNIGFVAGFSDTTAGEQHAFLYTVDPSGNVLTRQDLGVLGGGYSYAYGVNDLGDVVGTSFDAAFLWNGASLADLNTLIPPGTGWHLNSAWGINNEGAIAGTGTLNGAPHAFLLLPRICADLNGDHLVDLSDLAALLAAFGCTGGTCVGDLDQNGSTDLADLATLLAQYATTCP